MNKLHYLNSRGMASQEKAWLEPPCPPLVWLICDCCGAEVPEEDMVKRGELNLCSGDCLKEWIEEFEEG